MTNNIIWNNYISWGIWTQAWTSNQWLINLHYTLVASAGLSNLRPTGRMQQARQYYVACEVIHILKVLAELKK